MIKINAGDMLLADYCPMCEWCVERYGPTDEGRWWIENLQYFVFRDDKDVTLFLLRWSK